MLNSLDSVLFTDNLPTLDVHGYDRDTARVEIDTFITNNITMKNNIVTIIHGIGAGILKKETHKLLKNDKRVKDYRLFYKNTGQTVILLNIKMK